MQHGQIRFYNQKEAYGFIEREQPGRDVFMHERNVNSGTPEVGAVVKFELADSERGPRAEAVIIQDG